MGRVIDLDEVWVPNQWVYNEFEAAGTVQSQFASPSGGPQGVGLDSSDCIWHADYSATSIYELKRNSALTL